HLRDSVLYKNRFPFDIFKTREGKLWVVTNQGTFEITKSGLDSVAFPKSPLTEGKNVYPRYQTADGQLWCTINVSDFVILENGSFRAEKMPSLDTPNAPPTPPLEQTPLIGMFQDEKGQFWMSYLVRGLMRYRDAEDFTFYDESKVAMISKLTGGFEDREGNIWVATRGGGFYCFTESQYRNYGTTEGLPDDAMFGIYEDSKGRMWLGAGSLGAAIMENGQARSLPLPKGSPVLSRVDNFFEEPEGTMLVASANGLFRYDSLGREGVDVGPEFGIPTATNVNNITEIDGDLWFSTLGSGVFRYNLETKTTQNYNRNNGLRTNSARDVLRDKKGDYWFGTPTGVSRLSNGEFITYGIESGLGSNFALDIALDKNDKLWVIAYDGGLARWDGDHFTNFGRAEGLASNLLYSVISDRDGDLWIGTQNGVDRLVIDEESEIQRIEHLGPDVGFAGVEMNGRSSYQDSKGDLWFGHLEGISKVSLSREETNELTPPITQIQNVSLGLDRTRWQDSSYQENYDSLTAWYKLPSNLKLKPEQNQMVFNFAAASYKTPERVGYQWRLRGLEDDWQAETELSQASYPSLPAGKYTFEVRAHGGNKVWGEPRTFDFVVKPPFYETTGFIVLAVILIAALIYLGVRARLAQTERQKARLEQIVAIRTEELAAQNRNIKDSISYAKRIQDAALPSTKRMNAAFPEHFIFFRPRDIVSGDFYWLSDHWANEGKTLLAAIDCTGHGVPGAFMSLIANDLLNYIVNEQKIISPARILETLHSEVRRVLNQAESDNRDGMDMSLILVDKNTKTLTFAGAKNPLVYTQNGMIKRIKGDPRPIGGRQREDKRTFSEHTISFEQPLTFYLYSDGFQDQFGGEDGRKFMAKPFRELLGSIASLSTEEQNEKLESTFNDWKSSHEQLDDVLVIGGKL
ncbi:MAG: two-component regulator propeller domain-containing protein, partial [Bacteroidota bacterium]